MSAMPVATTGVVFVHSAPSALIPHVTWAIEAALGQRVTFDWTPQPAGHNTQRTEISWSGPAGTGDRLASALRSYDQLRYEVTEDASAGNDGSRWSFTPRLGLHRTQTSANGDAVVSENMLRQVLEYSMGSPEAMQDMLEELLGLDWDEELEVFRHAGEGAPVRWLHKVG